MRASELQSALMLACILKSVATSTLLALPVFGGNSPSQDVMSLAGELQSRGHDIVTATTEPDVPYMLKAAHRHIQQQQRQQHTTDPGTLTFLTVPAKHGTFQDLVGAALMSGGNNKTGPVFLKVLPVLKRVFNDPCSWMLTNHTLMEAVRAAKPSAILSFDLPIGPDSCACIMSHALGVPVVLADGNPMVIGPLSTPQYGAGLALADLKTPLGMLRNVAQYLIIRGMLLTVPRLLLDWKGVRVAGGVGPAGEYGGCRPALHLLLKNFDLEYARPLPPGHLLFGPGTPRLPNPPQQQQADHPATWAFLEGADPAAGVVLVGFGSTGVMGLAFSNEDYIHLAEAFSDLAPTRVLWALLPSNLPQGLTLADLPLGPNVLVVPWVDYNDVLGHPATRLFISHCGIHSMWEAAFHGVPVVGVPVQWEQRENALKLASQGMGEVNKESVAYRSRWFKAPVGFQRDTMRDLALKVLSTSSYREAAVRISARLQAQAAARHPMARAADAVEALLQGLGDAGPSQHVEGVAGTEGDAGEL